ncbi:MAG: hypothetical protein WC124_01980 [Desulfoplanes sp.]
MTNITIECPACERDTVITDKMIKSGIRHSKDLGRIFVWCDQCCRVLVMPDGIPTEGMALDQWITSEAENPDDCCGCVPLLDETPGITPTGSTGDLGVMKYIPGNGGKAIGKWDYMAAYGINPECHMAKNPSMGGKPFKTGR